LNTLNKSPEITIYIVSYNYGHFLKESINSVLNQICKNWELILIDDGSTDDTEEICRSYLNNEKVSFFKNESRQGLQFCANFALEITKTELLLRLDADDYLTDFATLNLVETAKKYPECALYYGNFYIVDEDGNYCGFDYENKGYDDGTKFSVAPHGAGTAIRTAVLKRYNGYNTKYNAQDGWDLWLKVRSHGSIKVDFPVFYYRVYNQSLSSNSSRLFSQRTKIVKDNALANKKFSKLVIIPIKTFFDQLGMVPFLKYGDENYIDYFFKRLLRFEDYDFLILVDSQDVFDHIRKNYSLSSSFSVFFKSNTESNSLRIFSLLSEGYKYFVESFRITPDFIFYLNFHCTNITEELLSLGTSYCLAFDKELSFPGIKLRDPIIIKKDSVFSMFNPQRFEGFDIRNEDAYVFEGSFLCYRLVEEKSSIILNPNNFTIIEEDFSTLKYL